MSGSPKVWALIDPAAGHANQTRGVAECLGWDTEEIALTYTAAARLPNWLKGVSLTGLSAQAKAKIAPPWPDLVLACGRRTAPVALAIKARSRGKTFAAQIMDPGATMRGDFDLLAVPRHDRPEPRANLLEITGAPHRIAANRLAEAAATWRTAWDNLPRPWIALLVGGATKRRPFTEGMAKELAQSVERLRAHKGGSLLVTTSRRTGDGPEKILRDHLTQPLHFHSWRDGGDNPYLGYLALADAVVATGDSVSMCCEAAATGKPVHIFAPEGFATPKHERLHAELYALGYARPLDGNWSDLTHAPLNAAKAIAAEIRKRMQKD